MRHLRRRATIARNGLLQILETADEHGFSDADWQTLEEEGRALARSLKNVERVEEMEFGVAQPGAETARGPRTPGKQLAAAAKPSLKLWIPTPRGRKTDPTNTTTNQPLILSGYGNGFRRK